MNKNNDRFRDFLGVTAWHAAGYTGARGLSATAEYLSTDQTDHGYKTREVFREIAPDRDVISLTYYGVSNDNMFDRVVNGALAQNVDTWWASEACGSYPKGIDAALSKAVNQCTFFVAAGNSNRNAQANRLMESPHLLGVSSALLNAINNALMLAPWDYKSQYIDFVAPSGVWVGQEHFTGTSCSAPVLAAMAALVNDMAYEKIGRPLSSDEMYQFLSDNARPVPNGEGYTGKGCVVLPPPDTVDFSKYCKFEETENMPVKIIEHAWDWSAPLVGRKQTDAIVLHHAAGNGSAEAIHEAHLANGWSGIGYHYYIRKNGEIHRGRPESMQGAHVQGENDHTIGICFEGNFEIEQMPDVQAESGRELLKNILERYPDCVVELHKELARTQCPGGNFPSEKIIEGGFEMTGEEIYKKLTEYINDLPESNWSKTEGGFRGLTERGVMDGTMPRGFVTREQLAAIIARMEAER